MNKSCATGAKKNSANIFGWRVSALHTPNTTGENTLALQEKSESFQGELSMESPNKRGKKVGAQHSPSVFSLQNYESVLIIALA